jgi:3-dehydroquinate dehydratase-2
VSDSEVHETGDAGENEPGRPVVLLLNGVNLNLLGERQPLIYGRATLADHVAATKAAATAAGFALEHVHSNQESELIEAVHAARGRCAAIVVNGAAFTHYAWGLHDALAAFEGPVIEVHISNPEAREPWRRLSVVSPVATGTISGIGGYGYVLAIDALRHLLA